MDLVTVTCLKEQAQMVLQAESIQKFVEPCTHWVIINEPILPDFKYWHSLLDQYYTKHTLKLISFHDDPSHDNYHQAGGYYSQQIFKLLVAKYIKEKYIVIDTKNIFIKSTNINDYNNCLGGHGSYIDYHAYNLTYQPLSNINDCTIRTYCKKLKIPASYVHLNCFAPFIIDARVINSVKDLDGLMHWFSSIPVKYNLPRKAPVYMCEYLLFSVIANKFNYSTVESNPLRSAYLWQHSKFSKETIDEFTTDNLIGFHYTWIANSTDEELRFANEWLATLGFKNTLKITV
jgi:hypothetical protein